MSSCINIKHSHWDILQLAQLLFNAQAVIILWNETVGDNDVVYILGDFSWYKEEKTAFILGCLKGHKVLIKGNHDHISQKSQDTLTGFVSMQKTKTEKKKS